MFRKNNILWIAACVLFIGALSYTDRVFFKHNNDFCIAFLYPNRQKIWNLSDGEIYPLGSKEEACIDEILKQKFRYLAKGCHCYAFISEDQKYVIKFHRYASHMRRFSWLYHPLSYVLNPRRQKIKEHNLERLLTNFKSYKDSYSELKEETGLLLVHINPSDPLHKSITLIDTMKHEYRISLDHVTFLLQHKADLIFPKLELLICENSIEGAKKLISHVIHLIAASSQKGYIDSDPVLRKNYGILNDRAIHIDVGDLIQCEEMKLQENYIPYIKSVTKPLRQKLENSPELLDHYDREILAISCVIPK